MSAFQENVYNVKTVYYRVVLTFYLFSILTIHQRVVTLNTIGSVTSIT